MSNSLQWTWSKSEFVLGFPGIVSLKSFQSSSKILQTKQTQLPLKEHSESALQHSKSCFKLALQRGSGSILSTHLTQEIFDCHVEPPQILLTIRTRKNWSQKQITKFLLFLQKEDAFFEHSHFCLRPFCSIFFPFFFFDTYSFGFHGIVLFLVVVGRL